jgi:hypothetical protein
VARHFSAAAFDSITFAIGSLANFAFGPGSLAALFRVATLPGAGVFWTICSFGSSNTVGYQMYIDGNASNAVTLRLNSTNVAGLAPSTAAWTLVVATKATGTVLPRFHFYNYKTGVWTHVNAGTTVADATAPSTSAKLGVSPVSTNPFDGDIAAVAVWNFVLTDAQCESLAPDVSIDNWQGSAKCRGMWLPNPAPAVLLFDAAGPDANETAHTGGSAVENPAVLNPQAYYNRLPLKEGLA